MFCAFQPKRVMVPSFALRFTFPLRWAFGCPEIPNPDFSGCVGLHIREDGRVGNRFNEACAKDRRWNSENNVRIPMLARERISGGQEIELGDVAAGGVGSPGDHEEVVH